MLFSCYGGRMPDSRCDPKFPAEPVSEPRHRHSVTPVKSRSPEVRMSSRFTIAVLIYSMTQAVLFGIGAVLVLATPLQQQAMTLMPVVVIASAIVALPFSWWIAPRLQ